MEKLSGSFTFTNKENTLQFNKAPPETPANLDSIIFKSTSNSNKFNVLNDAFRTPLKNERATKRLPLGGKDKNAPHLLPKLQIDDVHKGHISTSASKRRNRRLRTPITNKSNRKLNIFNDFKDSGKLNFERKNNGYNDKEIEYVPEKEDPIAFVPLNYEPFTNEDLTIFQQSPSQRLADCTLMSTDDEADSLQDFPVHFDISDNESEKGNTKKQESYKPRFMEHTISSTVRIVKPEKIEVYDDGLSTFELSRLIEE